MYELRYCYRWLWGSFIKVKQVSLCMQISWLSLRSFQVFFFAPTWIYIGHRYLSSIRSNIHINRRVLFVGRSNWAIKSTLRGKGKWTSVKLLKGRSVILVRQCCLPGGHAEIMDMVKELYRVGIIRATHSPFNNPVWPVCKPGGSWKMTVDFLEQSMLQFLILPND